jgi:hypothetical protein
MTTATLWYGLPCTPAESAEADQALAELGIVPGGDNDNAAPADQEDSDD